MKPKRTIYTRIVTRSRNKHGYPGVRQWYNDFRASIRFGGKTHDLGVYATAKDAYKAYCKAARDLGIKLKVKK